MNYDDPKIWNNYDPDNQAGLRLEVLKSLIPQEVTSILDAGCGNGLITNQLASEYAITGIDTSAEALTYLRCPAYQASVTAIPFADNSFDLVMCNEVLEHLDDISLATAILELERVSSKYILISVPHAEQLAKLLIHCAECGFTEHPYSHLQAFTVDRLSRLLAPDFALLTHRIFGPQTRDFQPFLLKLRQQVFHQWFKPYEGCVCAKCGSRKFSVKSSLFTKAINGLNLILMPARPFWLMALYQKRADA